MKRGDEAGRAVSPAALDWEAVARQYRPRLLRTAYLITGNPSEAEDATQAAFLKAISGTGSFRGESGVYTWLYRILVNQCLNQLRTRGREQGPPDEDTLPAGDGQIGPEGALLAAETAELVRREVLRLEPIHRAAIVLRHYEGLSYDEMSRVLGCRVGTVRSRLANAREILRARLEGKL